MTQIIKALEMATYLIELRKENGVFLVSCSNQCGDPDHYRTIKSTRTTNEKTAKNTFYRYARELKNR